MGIANVFVAILLSALVLRAEHPPVLTGQHLNGRGWRGLNPDMKIGYVVAMSEAPVLCDTHSSNNRYVFNEVLTRAEIIEAIDKFYAEPANTAVIVAFAYRYLALKASGASETQLAHELSRLRAVARDLSKE